MNNKIISVIIPIFNRASYLDQCIGSVLAQENVDTEIILVDDGSTDESPHICDTYAAKYPNITVIHNTNHGVSYSRNCALDIAKGDYIFFLDSDDALVPDALFSLKNALEENDADYCIGNVAVYKEDGTLDFVCDLNEYKNKTLSGHSAYRATIDIIFPILVVVWGKLFKKEIWNDLRFSERSLSEDNYILPDLIERSNRIYFLDKVIYHQYLSSGSLFRSELGYNSLDQTESYCREIDYLISKEYYDVALYRFGQGTRKLLLIKSLLKEKKVQKRIKQQYKVYRKFSRRLLSHVNTKHFLRLILFNINLSLYDCVRKKVTE